MGVCTQDELSPAAVELGQPCVPTPMSAPTAAPTASPLGSGPLLGGAERGQNALFSGGAALPGLFLCVWGVPERPWRWGRLRGLCSWLAHKQVWSALRSPQTWGLGPCWGPRSRLYLWLPDAHAGRSWSLATGRPCAVPRKEGSTWLGHPAGPREVGPRCRLPWEACHVGPAGLPLAGARSSLGASGPP